MATEKKLGLYTPYVLMLGIYVLFLAFALVVDSPQELAQGLWRIITSRSILITDYIELGGLGATLVNAVLVGCFSIALLVRNGIKPNGSIIMAVWLTTGFGFFGKNIFNMWPITLGVWLFSRYQREPFKNFALASLLCATLSPVVSEIAFIGLPLGILWGILLGVLIGFVFPAISTYTVKVHMGYCLYNMGFSGGLIATFVVSVLWSLGVDIETASYWNGDYTLPLAVFLYLLAALLIAVGLWSSGARRAWQDLRQIGRHSGRLVADFYLAYQGSVYVNMGLLFALGTTVVLLLGGDLNGPTIGGILTIGGFGCFGKHLRNVWPVLAGAILCTYWNTWNPTAPVNMLAILFSTGLAPIAGQFGWLWGMVTGFVHVNIAARVGALNAGLNLYNNGFAGGLVAMLLVPVIMTFRREKNGEI